MFLREQVLHKLLLIITILRFTLLGLNSWFKNQGKKYGLKHILVHPKLLEGGMLGYG